MKKYIINGQELYPANQVLPDNDSFELRTKFNNLLEALGTPVPEPKKEFKRWRAEYGKDYYYIDSCHFIRIDDDVRCGDSNRRYSFGNYYQTEILAKKALDKRLALTKLNDIINEKNEGWVADWDNLEQTKYIIRFDNDSKNFCSDYYRILNTNPFVLSIKNKEITQEIIKNHKDLLDTLWGVESK